MIFPNKDKKENKYANIGNNYINCSDGNPYTSHPTTVKNPGAHMNSSGYVRHSGIQPMAMGMDSCNTEATLLTGGQYFYPFQSNSRSHKPTLHRYRHIHEFRKLQSTFMANKLRNGLQRTS